MIERRVLLKLAMTGLAVGPLTSVRARLDATGFREEAASRLRVAAESVFQNAAPFHKLGASASVGARENSEFVESLISDWMALSPASDLDSDRELLRALLASRVRNDFRMQNVVSVDGWVLSDTEVQFSTFLVRMSG